MKTFEEAMAEIDLDAPLQPDPDPAFLEAMREVFGYPPAAPTLMGGDEPTTVLH